MPKYLLIRAGGRSFEWGCGWEISDETTFSPRVAKCHFWRFQDFEIFLLFLLSFYVFYQIFLPGRRKCTSKYDVSGGKGGRTLTLEMLRRLGSWNFCAALSDTLAHPCYAGPDEIMVGPRADADIKNGGLFSEKDGRFRGKRRSARIRVSPFLEL